MKSYLFSGLPKRLKADFFKNRFYVFIFWERGREGERGGEKHQCVVASRAPPTGDLACNPGMWPQWESNQWPFASQSGTQSTEPHQPGLKADFDILFSSNRKRMDFTIWLWTEWSNFFHDIHIPGTLTSSLSYLYLLLLQIWTQAYLLLLHVTLLCFTDVLIFFVMI